jgi:hypothetical protein
MPDMDESTQPRGSSVYDGPEGGSSGAGGPQDAGPAVQDRPHGPHNIQNRSGEFDASIRAAEDRAAAAERARLHGVSVPLLASGTAVHDMIQTLFNKDTTDPDDLRPVAEAFRRHCAAKQATIGRALESRSTAGPMIRREHEESVQLLAQLDRAIASSGPAGTRPLTVNGILADIDQLLAHEQRDLIPLIERELPVSESGRLAAAFRA